LAVLEGDINWVYKKPLLVKNIEYNILVHLINYSIINEFANYK